MDSRTEYKKRNKNCVGNHGANVYTQYYTQYTEHDANSNGNQSDIS